LVYTPKQDINLSRAEDCANTDSGRPLHKLTPEHELPAITRYPSGVIHELDEGSKTVARSVAPQGVRARLKG